MQIRLLDASAAGNVSELCKLFANSSANADTFDYDGKSALHLASAAGQFDAACLLVNQRAQVNTKDRWGNEPLKEAIANGHCKIVDMLRQHGATLSVECNTEFELKMCNLASRGDLAGVKHLVESGISCNATDYDRRTALQIAQERGHAGVVQYLASMGADTSTHRRDRWAGSETAAALLPGPAAKALLAPAPTSAQMIGGLLEAAAAGNVAELDQLLELGCVRPHVPLLRVRARAWPLPRPSPRPFIGPACRVHVRIRVPYCGWAREESRRRNRPPPIWRLEAPVNGGPVDIGGGLEGRGLEGIHATPWPAGKAGPHTRCRRRLP